MKTNRKRRVELRRERIKIRMRVIVIKVLKKNRRKIKLMRVERSMIDH